MQLSNEELQEDCRRIVEALEANNCLREFHLMDRFGIPFWDFSIILEHLCRNETLNEVTIDSGGVYEGELQLCVSSIQYFTCLHLVQRTMQRKHPLPNRMLSLLDYPLPVLFYIPSMCFSLHVQFIDASGLFNQALWYPLTPLQ